MSENKIQMRLLVKQTIGVIGHDLDIDITFLWTI